MYWAGERLGPVRVKGAYAFKQLLQQNGWIPLGTDFPVEDISPFKTFLAAVFRVDAKGLPGRWISAGECIDKGRGDKRDDYLGGEGGLPGKRDR